MGSVSKSAQELSGLVVPGIIIIGGVIVFSKILPLVGGIGGLQKALDDLIAFLKSPLGGGTSPKPIHIALSHDSAQQGDSIGIAVDGLKPNTQLVYGWRELNFSATGPGYVSQSDGTWYGPGGDIVIASTTPPGTYTVYVDQRPYGGPGGSEYETKFTVLAGPPPPQEYTPQITIAKTQGYWGELIGFNVTGLKPLARFVYGWRELNFTKTFLIPGGTFSSPFVISSSTPARTYTIYIDQRDYGGGYDEVKFTVLGAGA